MGGRKGPVVLVVVVSSSSSSSSSGNYQRKWHPNCCSQRLRISNARAILRPQSNDRLLFCPGMRCICVRGGRDRECVKEEGKRVWESGGRGGKRVRVRRERGGRRG